ncbi:MULTISPECIES: hypothetical protein [Microbacterium]|uniref:DUF7882 family protein n=1 Tax=Microbacterium TaxID=33882 RepID=UPI000D64E181|nr:MULTISPECIES: hypothetical protein [Microbacterium]
MAQLIYGADGAAIEIPEHLLVHVKAVIATKLRRNESFMMSWRHPDGSGRSSIWLQPAIPLRFVFDTPEEAVIDRELLSRLAAAASSNGGLTLELEEVSVMPSSSAKAARSGAATPKAAQPAA